MTSSGSTKTSWRRFSIASLLLLMTCVGLGIGLGVALLRTQEQSKRYRNQAFRLAEENRRLQEEYGEFTVEDPELFYAAQINRDETADSRMLDWKWRVYIPNSYTLCLADSNVSRKGYAKPDDTLALERGYHTIRLRYHTELDNQNHDWQIELIVDSTTDAGRKKTTHTRRPQDRRWPPPRYADVEQWRRASPVQGVNWGLVTVRDDQSQSPEKRVVLQRLLVKPDDPLPPQHQTSENYWVNSLPTDEPVPGFLIWLQPNPK